MKIQTGESYESSAYAKVLAVSDPKVGKTFFLLLGMLGLLPWQKKGGVVDKPSHLHVLTSDANALGNVQKTMKQMIVDVKSLDALKFNVYNMQDDLNLIHTSKVAWDMSFYNQIVLVQQRIQERVTKFPGVHVVLVSSLTGLAAGILRGIQGPPAQETEGGSVKKGSGMDQAKWSAFAGQVAEIRSMFQLDLWHCIWEAHLHKPSASGQKKDDGDEADAKRESLQIPGQSGANFAYNVEQVFRIRRNFGRKYQGSKIEEVFFDTAPSVDFITGGRNVTESLNEKEYDPTVAFEKLGLRVGHWGHTKKVVK